MEKRKGIKRGLALSLVFAMLLTYVPGVSVYAAEMEEGQPEEVQEMITDDQEDLVEGDVVTETDIEEETPDREEEASQAAEVIPEDSQPEKEAVDEEAIAAQGDADSAANVGDGIEAQASIVNGSGVITPYPTFKLAIDEAVSGQTIRIESSFDTTEPVTIPSGKVITLDLNGKKITYRGERYGARLITNNGTLTITGNGTMEALDQYTVGLVLNNAAGEVTIENGTFYTNSYDEYPIVTNWGKMTINGGNFESASSQVSANYLVGNVGNIVINDGNFTDNTADTGIYAVQSRAAGAYMEINGGHFQGKKGPVSITGGNYLITGGTFRAKAYYAAYIAGAHAEVSGTIAGGDFASEGHYPILVGNDVAGDGGVRAKAYLMIAGGTFASTSNRKTINKAEQTGKIEIKGGTFLVNGNSADESIKTYLIDGYYLKTTTGTVKEKEAQSWSIVSEQGMVTTDTADFKLKVTSSQADYDGGMTFEVTDGDSVTVTKDEGQNTATVKVLKEGITEITITRAATGVYAESSKTITIQVLSREEAAGKSPSVIIVPEIVEGETATLNEATIQAVVETIDEANGQDVILQAPVNNIKITKAIVAEFKQQAAGSQHFIIEVPAVKEGEIAATFTFTADDITSSNIDIYSGITVTAQPASIVTNGFGSGTKKLAISLAHEGNFPGPAKITLDIGTGIAAVGSTVYLYYVNPTTNKLELVDKNGYRVNEDQTITFTLNHASDYVIANTAQKLNKITLNKNSVALNMKQTIALQVTFDPGEAAEDITWTTSDAGIAKVDAKGVVTAVTPGKATITATAKSGSKTTCTVTVNKLAVPTNLKAASASYKSVKVTWSKVSLASDYQVYRATSKNGKYTSVKTTSGASFTNSGLTTGKAYYYKVRASVKVGTKTIYSDYSNPVKVSPKLAAPKLKTKTASGKVKASWKKVDGATGYKLYRIAAKNSKDKCVKDLSKNFRTYTSIRVKKGTKYYYKLRAYRTVNGKKVYSSYSETILVTVK